MEMRAKALQIVLASAALCLGCSSEGERREPREPQQPTEQRVGDDPTSFVNKVWEASDSTGVEAGTIYVFLSEGTLLITSSREKPMIGTWRRDGEGLTMVEEGEPYKVDILRLSADEFRIRSNNPGGAVEIRLVPASTSPASM
ncbi:MAG TPA: hypothetical protein VJW75_06000 [Candidatus Eisenbacteria bacterium]|nr:hypothetical protein [Candidatus Eisenbacteria bacterium]